MKDRQVISVDPHGDHKFTTSYYVRAPLYATGRLGPGKFGRTQDMLAPNPAFPAIMSISLEGIVGYMARLELD
jgi:hypothetical protein